MSTSEPSGAGAHGPAVVAAGNLYDKYASRNPLVRWRVQAFRRCLWELLDELEPRSILDVGCGEGVLTAEAARRYPGARVVGVDRGGHVLRSHWQRHRSANLFFHVACAEELPFAARAFDVVLALELLEHLTAPEKALQQITAVSSLALIASVPREPLWRLLNLCRGAYVARWGNTPGHVNHWSKRAFAEFISRQARIDRVLSPLPWTMIRARPHRALCPHGATAVTPGSPPASPGRATGP